MQTTPRQAGGALEQTSGRDRDAWFRALDEWGAIGRPYREIADWLTAAGLSDWWAQKVIVEYEQERGVRDPGVRRDGTFAGGASKTITAPAAAIFDAFVDSDVRARWLPGVELTERTSRPGRSARFDLSDGTRLSVDVNASDAKSQVAVEQTLLPDARAAADAKVSWRERLAVLKELLES